MGIASVDYIVPYGTEIITREAVKRFRNYSQIVIPDTVKIIEKYAFADFENLTEVEIPNGVEIIKNNAFMNAKLTKMSIPESVLEIWETALGRADSYNVYEGCNYLGNEKNPYFCLVRANQKSYKKLTIHKDCKIIYGYAFCEIRLPKELTIPDGIRYIGEGAFTYCKGLREVVISESVMGTGKEVFHFCKSLTTVKLPTGLKVIREDTFGRCDALRTVVIPESVIEIERHAFERCKSLTEVKLPTGLKIIGAGAFLGCIGLREVVIPPDVISIGWLAFYKTQILFADIPNGLKEWGGSVFSYNFNFSFNTDGICKYLGDKINPYLVCLGPISNRETKIVINDKCRFIESRAFECSNLTEITIPEGVESINSGAFGYCEGLKEINIPDSVTTIHSYAFKGCTNLSKIKMPSGLKEIREDTFEDCKSLIELDIPSVAIVKGRISFYGCEKLYRINIVFGERNALDKLSNENLNYINLYGNQYSANNALSYIDITDIGDNSVLNINKDWLDECKNLHYNEYMGCKYLGNKENSYLYFVSPIFEDIQSVIINENCKFIGEYAFKECKRLTALRIPRGVKEIRTMTLVENLTQMLIPKSVVSIWNLPKSIRTIYYEGTEDEWEYVYKSPFCENLDADIIFNSYQ